MAAIERTIKKIIPHKIARLEFRVVSRFFISDSFQQIADQDHVSFFEAGKLVENGSGFGRGGAEFGTQALDVDIDHVGEGVEALVPDVFGQSPDRSAPRTDCDLFPALLHPLSQVFQCRHDGPGCTR